MEPSPTLDASALELGPLLRQDPLATLDAIRRLDLHLVDCDGPIARGIVSRAIRYLEADLRLQLTGPRVRPPEGR
jgi:hypothetical protein